jgi:hypothetical protein
LIPYFPNTFTDEARKSAPSAASAATTLVVSHTASLVESNHCLPAREEVNQVIPHAVAHATATSPILAVAGRSAIATHAAAIDTHTVVTPPSVKLSIFHQFASDKSQN